MLGIPLAGASILCTVFLVHRVTMNMHMQTRG